MYKYFLDNYENKSKEDLLGIMASQHVQHKDAARAAAKLLGEKYDVHTEIKKRRKTSFFSNKYIRAFSKREFMTIISMALLFAACFMIIHYFRHIEIISENTLLILILCFLLISVKSHVYYRREHKRSNEFLGRVIQSYMLIVVIAILTMFLRTNVWGEDIGVYGEEWLFLPFGLFIIVFCIEVFISFLKIIVNLFKWQI